MKKLILASVLLLFALPLARLAAAAEPRLIEDFDATWKDGRWTFSNGGEFPGAKGSFERSKAAAHGGEYGGCLAFDFSGGGAYVSAILSLPGAPDVAAVKVWVKKPRANGLTFRYTDQTGQTLQTSFSAPDDRWADITIPMAGWSGHWGGANDGVVHGPPKQIAFNIDNTGRKQGQLLFDDVRLIEGKPGEGLGQVVSEYTAARFAADEGWYAQARGGSTRLDGHTWHFDFSKGGDAIGIAPPDASLLGSPKEIRVRIRGNTAGHPVTVHIATHFMTFQKTLPPVAGDGENDIVIPAPPGEGWTWHGGENDGKVHGPLRLRGIWLERAGLGNSGQIELIDIRCKTACQADRACVMTAGLRETSVPEFVATLYSLLPKPAAATVTWTVRDWAGKTVAEGKRPITLPAAAEPVQVTVPALADGRKFLEAEFELDTPGQNTPPVQAYYVAPLDARGSPELEPSSPFGMGVYLYRYGGDPAGLKEMDRAAQAAQDAGVKWSREEFGWGRIETQPGKFNWTFYDNLVATARRHGISVYAGLSYWPGWAKAYTPEGIEGYSRFAAAAAERYKDDVVHWEIWNEPNIFFWQGPKDMYAELLKQSYAAIKKANPKAQVLGCSTAGIDTKFIKRTMELGATFDLLTIHPYRSYLDDHGFIADLVKVADLVKLPDGTRREVWITEMGWTTQTPHNGPRQDFMFTTQRDQAQLLARAYIDAIASAAAPNISWYDFRNDGTDPFNFEHNMGVMTRDFHPKPAYRAYATMTQMLKGKRPTAPPDLGKNVIAFAFADADGKRRVLTLWGQEDDGTAVVPAPKGAVLTDLMGNQQTLAPADGKVTVPVQVGRPVFLTPTE